MTQHDPLSDGISAVQLLNHMGDDLTVVNAARVSMAKQSEWEWEFDVDSSEPSQRRVLSMRDAKLIKYLANHDHWTPFSHCMVTLRIKMPIFVARQWFKHQVGFTRNEVSRRYVDDAPEFFIPTHLRLRAENVKQGSSDETVPSYRITRVPVSQRDSYYTDDEWDIEEWTQNIAWFYADMVEKGVAPEVARMVLPQNMYTEFWETASLAGYARVAKLRLDSHAQKEVQHYASAVDQIMRDLFPVSWAAIMGYDE